MGPLWENYPGVVPKEPYQPEFVILILRKYKNGTIALESAEIHSDNLSYQTPDSPVEKLLEFWFICNAKSDFMIATLVEAYKTCKQLNSTIKTYYSKKDMLKFMTRVIFASWYLMTALKLPPRGNIRKNRAKNNPDNDGSKSSE